MRQQQVLIVRVVALIVRVVASSGVGLSKSVVCMHVRLKSILKIGEEAKVGTCNGFKFITKMWTRCDEFGTGVIIMSFPRQGGTWKQQWLLS
eukprot:1149770-Pelagomonas_calceolata.AAC.4